MDNKEGYKEREEKGNFFFQKKKTVILEYVTRLASAIHTTDTAKTSFSLF